MTAASAMTDDDAVCTTVSDTGPIIGFPVWVLGLPLKPLALKVYLIHLDIADYYRGVTHHKGRRYLAERANCSFDTLDRCHEQLVEYGLLEITHRVGDEGDPTSNLYLVKRVPPEGYEGPMLGREQRDQTCVPGSRKDAATGSRKNAALVVQKNKLDIQASRTRAPARGGEHVRPAPSTPRLRGDDRSGEPVGLVVREEPPDASLEKQQPKDPPRVPLYAEVNPIVHGNQLEPLTDQYVAVGLEQIRALKAAQYHPTVLDPKGAS